MLLKEKAMKSVPKSQFSHILNLYIALESYNLVFIFFIIHSFYLLKDYSTVSHKAQARNVFIYKKKIEEYS